MPETLTCPNGHPVSSQDVSCPNCRTILQHEPLPLPTSGNVPTIPGYEILGELGRGGMGVVFKARQLSLKRLVALKMILGGGLADSKDLARFHAEANAVARLQHPNIVQIHEVGEYRGLPFLSLEFVEGGTLAEYMHGIPQPPRAAAQMLETLARAMHAVHEVGLVHRDLKPGNVMLQHAGAKSPSTKETEKGGPEVKTVIASLQSATPKITDFGLAKQLGESKQLTPSGAVLGTPSYMAPEQAIGKPGDIGPAADIYALGAILYEALTGRPPYLGESAVHTLQQVLHENVVPPRHLQPKIPADLETICLKCLQREPERRFASSLALAEDLHRYLEGKPIFTRPVGYIERFWRWCRRNPWEAGLTAAVALALVAGAVVSLYFALQTLEREKQLSQQLYVAQMKRLQQAWDDGQIVRFQELLDEQPPEMQAFEWSYWKQLMERSVRLPFPSADELAEVVGVVFSPDGRQVAAVSKESVVQGWDVATRDATFIAKDFDSAPGRLLFTPDGRYLVGISDKDLGLLLLDTRSGTVTHKLKDISQVAVSSNGQFLACALQDRNVVVLDLTTGQEVRKLGPHQGNIAGLAFSKDDRLLAVADYRPSGRFNIQNLSEIKIWDARTGLEAQTLAGDLDSTLYLTFSADGQKLVSVARDQMIRLWDTKKGKELRSIKGPGGGKIEFVAYSPDGGHLAYTSGDETVQVFDCDTLEQLKALTGHAGKVARVVFSADGKLLATASQDRTVKVWDAATSQLLRGFRGHTGTVNAVAFGPGSRLASAAGDGSVRFWQADQDQGAAAPPTQAKGVTAVGFFPGSHRLALGQEDGTLRFVPGSYGQATHDLKAHSARVTCLAFGPAGTNFASAGQDETLLIWAKDNDLPIHRLKENVGEVTCMAFSPDSHKLATADKVFDRVRKLTLSTVKLWDVGNAQVFTFPAKSAVIVELAFSSDGKTLSGITENGGVETWDAATGNTMRTLPGQSNAAIATAAFSPDGHSFAMALGQTVELHDLASGRRIHVLKGYDSPVRGVAYNPQGNRLATAYKDGTVKIWHVALGQEVLTLKGRSDSVTRVTFSGDGQSLAAAGTEIKIWLGK